MKILLGLTKVWETTERRELKQVDLREFLMEHYPREHGWRDEKEALVFLQNALHTEQLQQVLRAMKDDAKNVITREEPELTHKKFWFEHVDEPK
jgi:hypothetical protein